MLWFTAGNVKRAFCMDWWQMVFAVARLLFSGQNDKNAHTGETSLICATAT